jgi:hypothetical protein
LRFPGQPQWDARLDKSEENCQGKNEFLFEILRAALLPIQDQESSLNFIDLLAIPAHFPRFRCFDEPPSPGSEFQSANLAEGYLSLQKGFRMRRIAFPPHRKPSKSPVMTESFETPSRTGELLPRDFPPCRDHEYLHGLHDDDGADGDPGARRSSTPSNRMNTPTAYSGLWRLSITPKIRSG